MKVTNTSNRLKQIMAENKLKQVDILNRAKPYCEQYDINLNKNNLSQYIRGNITPSQDKLFVLALALDVNEGWLLGYNVSKERGLIVNGFNNNNEVEPNVTLVKEAAKKISLLPPELQQDVLDYIDFVESKQRK